VGGGRGALLASILKDSPHAITLQADRGSAGLMLRAIKLAANGVQPATWRHNLV